MKTLFKVKSFVVEYDKRAFVFGFINTDRNFLLVIGCIGIGFNLPKAIDKLMDRFFPALICFLFAVNTVWMVSLGIISLAIFSLCAGLACLLLLLDEK
jgi:hypothetical protein